MKHKLLRCYFLPADTFEGCETGDVVCNGFVNPYRIIKHTINCSRCGAVLKAWGRYRITSEILNKVNNWTLEKDHEDFNSLKIFNPKHELASEPWDAGANRLAYEELLKLAK